MISSAATPAPPMAPSTRSSLLVKLSSQPRLEWIDRLPRGPLRKQIAHLLITSNAQRSQPRALELAQRLRNEGAVAGYESLVSPNMLVVTPTPKNADRVAAAFHALQGVAAIYSNGSGARIAPGTRVPTITDDTPTWGLDVVDEPLLTVEKPAETPYGIGMVGAPESWARGADGTGLVFGSIDTGADVTHEAIAGAYRGRNADGTVNHDYSWFDASGRSATPVDTHGHGTHTIGTAVGTGVGVAPGAKFISASGLGANVDGALKAMQWMLAPTRIDGSGADPRRAPDVVGMSWFMGADDDDLFQDSLRNLRGAGIVPVKSAGNRGPGTSTITSPGQFDEIISTAAVDEQGAIARFSSRGPSRFPKGTGTAKPDYAAPGVAVISSVPGNKYSAMSGTSMAQPHMSGVILDVLSKYPRLSHAQLKSVLDAGSRDAGAPGFDAEFGAGIVNLPAILDAAERLTGSRP